MAHLKNFLELRGRYAPKSVLSIQKISNEFVLSKKHLKGFTFTEPYTTILVGQVQSGKTGHYLGIAAGVADVEPRFPIFLLLTQSLVALQQQTYYEAKKLLTTFDVFDENEEMAFRHSLKYSKPKMVVLKKTKAPLKKWAQILDRKLLRGMPLFIIDDEADATGLNTKVNVSDKSEINRLIEHMVVENNSFLLQVTATPHAIFLQNNGSIFRPKSHLYFPPGTDYLGGKFFYPMDVDLERDTPYTLKITGDSELSELQDPAKVIPKGLEDAIFTFILTAAYRIGYEKDHQCNFLLHPSARTFDHNLIRDKVKKFVLDTQNSFDSPKLQKSIAIAYKDLKTSKPQLPNLFDLIAEAKKTAFNVTVMNSSPGNLSRALPVNGANVFIGGNVLSRGIVVPKLQTIYYCRTAQRITLDTYWQHSRAFGYDRDPTLVRLFMPARLYSNFVQMSESIILLFKKLENSNVENVQVVTPLGIAPTRSAVVDNLATDFLVGGAHYFPSSPVQKNTKNIDHLLEDYSTQENYHIIDSNVATQLLLATGNSELGGVSLEVFLNSLKFINQNGKVVLIVRRGRRITASTGTLISPDDRALANKLQKDAVLILYQLTGERSKGWGGLPFWIPNVKLPLNKVIYFKRM